MPVCIRSSNDRRQAVNGCVVDLVFFNKIIECAFIIVMRELNAGNVKRNGIEVAGFFHYVKKGNE